ncbi:choline-sulfatase [candidate division KSB3 bacterium]|uniref:Choline-sulfatase n=1 Tax=candidate division KSB3 bacterium TaxID=2044937 RepID=A0A9D5Q6H9_9BACT|nr:choline-sulfatase [candidate division KSB3 bacterium]MBD3325408.1 choline-sulfatase [candidate division KSB3 bacterium]
MWLSTDSRPPDRDVAPMKSQPPNILLIMADQLIPFLTGAYGHEVVKTPHLNRLVEDGIRFDAAYSPCPVCAPARAALMTGRYASNIGAYDNAAAFSCEEPTVAHYLSLAGYDTVLSGKMHFIGPDQLHGFSRRFTTNVYPADFEWVPVRNAAKPLARNHALQYVGEAVKIGRWNQFLSGDEETQFRAVEYLRAKGLETEAVRLQGGTPQPFFLCVSYHHPHEPFWPPQDLWDLYADAEIAVPHLPDQLEATYSILDRWLNIYHGVAKAADLRKPASIRRVRRAYYALVTYVDRKVGELLDALRDNGFGHNTIVVFTSDHGDMLCERGMVQKRTFYEWSSRIPLIMRFPNGWQAGRRCPEPVNLIDLMPTLLDLVGIADAERVAVDGRSLLGLVDGSDENDREVFAEYHSQGCHAPCFMIRQGSYKYVSIHGYESQLFDLEADPGEWHTLSGNPAYQEIEAALHARVLEQFDPDAIDAAVTASIRKRELIQHAMSITGLRWDIEPRFDPTKGITDQYLLGKGTAEILR